MRMNRIRVRVIILVQVRVLEVDNDLITVAFYGIWGLWHFNDLIRGFGE